MDGERMRTKELTEEEKERAEKLRIREELMQPHRFAIKLGDIQMHCPTEGCLGCKATLRGTTRQLHKHECRKRFETLMKDNERVKRSVTRETEFYERVAEADAKRRKHLDDAKEEWRDKELESVEEMITGDQQQPQQPQRSGLAIQPRQRLDEVDDEKEEQSDEKSCWKQGTRRRRRRKEKKDL